MAETSLVTPITPEHFESQWWDVPERAYPKLPPRAQIEGAIETLIGILDAADPDSDFEEVGAEDSFELHHEDGAGCPVSDLGGGNVEDEPHDWDELEVDEGVCGFVRVYGVDQTRPIGPDNPQGDR